MTNAIPRSLVASALGVDEAALPAGDLPLDRFAARFLAYLGETLAAEDGQHPEAWTFLLFDVLVETNPGWALDALLACLARCATPEEAALIAAGPLDDLIARQGVGLIGRIEALASTTPRFAYALSGLRAPEDGSNALLWARLAPLGAAGPQIDEGDPLPVDDGL